VRDEPLDAVIALGWNHVEEVSLFERSNHVCSVKLSIGEYPADTQVCTVFDDINESADDSADSI
jgi:hypothetical protein